jgi:hypothetical protein
MPMIVALLATVALVFCFVQFVDLMRRRDDEFPGRFDKLVWALAIVFTNVFGAVAYLICKPRSVPESNAALRAELADARQQTPTSGPESAG